jgi:tetratricopeptide (TPR) repeat protein
MQSPWRLLSVRLLIVSAVAASACVQAQQVSQQGLQQDLQQDPQKYLHQDLYTDVLNSMGGVSPAEAGEALQKKIEQEPQNAGAWLDLAIIQCESGHADKAEHLFNEIEERFAPPPVIQQIIAEHRQKGCHEPQRLSRLSVMLGRGADTNVNQGANLSNFTIGSGDYRINLQLLPEYLAHHDEYTIFSADYSRELNNSGSLGFAQVQARVNDSLTRYNTTAVLAGLEQAWRFRGWGLWADGMATMVTLGDQLYQKQTQLLTRISPDLPLPSSIQANLVAALSHVQYPTVTDFDSNTAELRGVLAYSTSSTQASAAIGRLWDHATADRPGGDRAGWLATAQARTRLTDRLFGEFGWSRQTWNGQTAYSPGLIDQIRYQDTQTLRGALVFPITLHQAIEFEARFTRDTENVPIFQYGDRQLQISWQWKNF